MRDVYDGRTALETYDADFDFVMEPTKEDEQYVLEYPLAVNGMPFGSFDGGSYSGDVWATGTSVKVFYGAEGLNMLAMPYALDVTDAGTPQPVLTLDEAIQKLEEKFDSMIVEGERREAAAGVALSDGAHDGIRRKGRPEPNDDADGPGRHFV